MCSEHFFLTDGVFIGHACMQLFLRILRQDVLHDNYVKGNKII